MDQLAFRGVYDGAMSDQPVDTRVVGVVQRFAGKSGWHYLPLSRALCKRLQARVQELWPQLLKAQCTLQGRTWTATVMPQAEGPLFVAIPAKVRKATGVGEGDRVSLRLRV